MIGYSVSRKVFFALSGLMCVLLLSTLSQAAEYSAKMVTRMTTNKTTGPAMPARTITSMIYVKGDKKRAESSFGAMKQVEIDRGDKKVSWLLNEASMTYVEMPYRGGPTEKGSLTDRIKQKYPKARRLGTETVNGLRCEKLQVQSTQSGPDGKPATFVTTLYVNKGLELPVKQVTQFPFGSAVSEARDIKTKPLPDSLFEIPRGYKKTAMPKMPSGMGGGPPAGMGRR